MFKPAIASLASFMILACAVASASFAGERISPSMNPPIRIASLSIRVSETAQAREGDLMLLGKQVAVNPKRAGMFSPAQKKLMRELSDAIDFIPGGVSLCWNIHY